ncbi:MAG: efflux RND transporter periplasmic adaptor subunit [Clostridiales bacterium]|nr:efflux RND transporter periplasmic adaptor subunit [Clostridiales bacterium]MCF8023453.1 efflux RND transporter periplasmic adaptor subunit [Clostridiales bacterium]
MHKITFFLSMFILIITCAGCGSSNTSLHTTGTIEAEEVQVITEISGTLDEIMVDEGDRVNKNEIVACIDPAQMELQLEQARAQQKINDFALKEIKSGNRAQEIESARENIKGLEASIKAARSNLELQKDLLEKYEKLVEQGAINKQKLTSQKNKVTAAEQEVNAAKARLGTAEKKLDLLIAGARHEKIEQAKASLEASQAKTDLARINLSKTKLTAPAPGTVMTSNFKKGEVVSPGSEIITLGDTDNLYIYTYISEARLNKVKIGQETNVKVDSYPEKTFKGNVTYISPEAEFTPQNVQTKEDRVRLVFKVKVEINSEQEKLLPGMPADLYF